MKKTTEGVTRTVKHHGLHWLNGGTRPLCPECDSDEIKILGQVMLKGSITPFRLQCRDCCCLWELTRTDEAEETSAEGQTTGENAKGKGSE